MAALHYEIRTTRGLSRGYDWATVSISGTTSPRWATRDLEELIERVWNRDSELTMTFARDVAGPLQSEISDAVQHLIRATAEGELCDALAEEGWQGCRYTVDERLKFPFGLDDSESSTVLIGFWTGPRIFTTLLIQDSELTSDREVMAGVSHWHPGSMTSGYWGSSISETTTGLLCEEYRRDEDGTYFTFRPSPGEPQEIAEAIRDFLISDYIYDAEDWFPILYSILGSDVSDLEPFTVDMLPDIANAGYEIDGLYVSPPDSAAEILRRIAAPTEDQRQRLRASVLNYVNNASSGRTLEDLGPLWQTIAGISAPNA